MTRREEEIPEFAKAASTTVVERKFNQDNSMFKNWIKDDPDKMSLIAETDFKYWKITEKMIKDEEDLLGVQELFKNNISKLKDIFANLASNSDWPCIT